MKKVFICSPYRGDIERNRKLAIQLCRLAFTLGYAPFAPHLLYPQILDETTPEGRGKGINAGLEYLIECDEMWLLTSHGITEGMEIEKKVAEKEGIIIKSIRI